MKKTLKSCFIFVLAITLVFTACPIAKAATVLKTGSAGLRVTWTIYDDERLVFSGKGRIQGYDYLGDIPYVCMESYTVTEIVIEEGITAIGLNAFNFSTFSQNYFKNLKTLTLPSTLTLIENDAFGGNLFERININTLSQWLKMDFQNETSNPFGTYGNNASLYVDGVKLTQLIIPESITQIKKYAFYGCSSLETVKLHDKVKSIGRFAFNSCSKLKDLYFYGDAPTFGRAQFILSNVTIHYPQNNATWTNAVKQSAAIPEGYKGSVQWKTHNLTLSSSSVYKAPFEPYVPSATKTSSKVSSNESKADSSNIETITSNQTTSDSEATNNSSQQFETKPLVEPNPWGIIILVSALVLIAAVLVIIFIKKKK